MMPMNELHGAFPPYCGAERRVNGRLVAICTRRVHDLRVDGWHTDIERSQQWHERGPLVRDPFTPSSGS